MKEWLKNYDPQKGEVENMWANGYYRYYDCGNAIYENME